MVMCGLVTALVACSNSSAKSPAEIALDNDPVFRAAMRDPVLRRKIESDEFRRAMRNPEFRKQVRAELSEKLYGSPRIADVIKLERKLNGAPCVGRLSNWDRLYGYRAVEEKGGIDPTEIAFWFREAGVDHFSNRMKIVPSNQLHAIDDRQYKTVRGYYNTNTGTIKIVYCGTNVPQQSPKN